MMIYMQILDEFDSFADTPIGTASLAQVHKAVLKDGTVLAIKVQHPRVKAHSFIDMNTMEVGMWLAGSGPMFIVLFQR